MSEKQIITLEQASEICIAAWCSDCIEMAKENWCQSQVEMLERLFHAVGTGKPYNYED